MSISPNAGSDGGEDHVMVKVKNVPAPPPTPSPDDLLIDLLAGQLQVVNVALQDRDFDVVLAESLQVICALHRSRTGLLVVSDSYSEESDLLPESVAHATPVDVNLAIRDSDSFGRHAVFLHCGRACDLTTPSGFSEASSLAKEMLEADHFLTAPLRAGTRQIGRIFVLDINGDGRDGSQGKRFVGLVSQMALALNRASVLNEARRRERATEALYQTVHEMTRSLQVDSLLETIVVRARELLGADTTFLSVRAPGTDEVYLRVSDGLKTRAFYESGYRLSDGLNGLAGARREPVVSPDYLRDDRFEHREHIDSAISAEEFVTLVCAPLFVKGESIGALFVGNRRPTRFSSGDVKLVGSLANSAAVAIEKAWLYENEREAVAKLQELNELITSQMEMLDNSIRIHDELAKLLLDGIGTKGIAASVANLVGNPVVVEDHLFQLVAQAFPTPPTADHLIEPTSVRSLSRDILHDAGVMQSLRSMVAGRRTIRMPAFPKYGLTSPRLISPLVVGGELLGYVSIVEEARTADKLHAMILERAATVLALELAREKAGADAERRLGGDLLSEILSGKIDNPEAVLRRASRFGYDLAIPRFAVAVGLDSPGGAVPADPRELALGASPGILLELVRHCSGRLFKDPVATAKDGCVVVLLPGSPGQTSASRVDSVSRLLEDVNRSLWQFTASAGIGRVCRELGDYPISWREAFETLGVIRRLGKPSRAQSLDQLGLLRLLVKIEDRGELSKYLSETVGVLLDYDRAHSGNLVATLRAYLQANGHMLSAARSLHIHVNTLLYRMQRIRDVGKVDLNDSDARLNLHAALKILESLDGFDLGRG